MNAGKCPLCGGGMVRWGKAASGRQRWRCKACGATRTFRIDNAAKRLGEFLGWLLGRGRMADMPGGGRTFRRRTAEFWALWPLPPKVEGRRDAVFVDAIRLEEGAWVLIACTDEHVLGWHLARSESARSYRALLSRIAEPGMAVSDGGSGFPSAMRAEWPGAAFQRCLVHVFRQVEHATTKRPRLDAGRELRELMFLLMGVTTVPEARRWEELFGGWLSRWEGFLAETTEAADGRRVPTHRGLARAARALERLVGQGSLFAFLGGAGPLPSTNNRIEGGVNARLRAMLRDHRGMSLERRAKAVFWWRHVHSPDPLPAAELLRTMPTDDDVAAAYLAMGSQERMAGTIPGWGDALMWERLHPDETGRNPWD